MKNQFTFPALRISRKLLLVILSTSALGLLGAPGLGARLYQTSGQTNPTVAIPGTFLSTEPTQSPQPVTSSGFDTENYWRIHQDALAGDFGRSLYRKNLGAGDTSDASGWTLTYRAKLGRALNAQFNSYFAVVDDTGHGHVIDLVGGSGEPNPHVGYDKASDTFPAFSTLASLDPTLAYHTYQMIFNPAGGGSTGYYIDGVLYGTLALAGLPSGIAGGPRLEWGRGQGTGGISETEWSLVSFEFGQHPVPGRFVVVQHVGMNCPTCETWTFFQSGAAILSSDIDPEGFWQIQQTNASAYYRHNLVSSNLTDPSGWTATMRVKLNRASGANTGLLNSYVSVADGRDAWILSLGGGADVPSSGQGVFDFFGARYATIDPTPGYRNYQMVYNPSGDGGNGSATYYLDGLVIGTETRAHAPDMTGLRIDFGDGDSTSSGGESDAQYALVRFELGQHPLAALLLSRSGDQLTLSWTAAGFLLQTNSNLLNPAGWADLPGGTNSPSVVTIGPGALFFRLRQ
jgi:hypothetical protein